MQCCRIDEVVKQNCAYCKTIHLLLLVDRRGCSSRTVHTLFFTRNKLYLRVNKGLIPMNR